MDGLGLGTDFEDGKEVSHNLLGPCQQDERHDRCDGTSNDEWSSLSPWRPTPVALDTDVRLDQCTRQWAGNPDEGEERLTNTQTEQIWLSIG